MKIQFYFLAVLMLCCYGYANAQNWNDCRTNNFNTGRNYFEVDDLSFTANYRGIRSYMNILALEDPDLHQKLQPQFQLIKRKREGAIITATAGGVIGSILIIASLPSGNSNPTRHGFSSEIEFPDRGLMIGGLGIMTIGGLIAAAILPRENHFLDFFNLHNRNTKNQKIQWRMGLNVWGNNAQGLRLQLQF